MRGGEGEEEVWEDALEMFEAEEGTDLGGMKDSSEMGVKVSAPKASRVELPVGLRDFFLRSSPKGDARQIFVPSFQARDCAL
jgi:hypothetical protein